jgi:replicative DNA helicase
LNRQIEQLKGRDSNHHPQLSHLRESGAIEQDADVVMFVHREERHISREEAEQRGLLGKAEIILAKQRQGRIGNIKLHWIGEYTKFKDETFSQNEAYDEFNAANISSDVGADANYSNVDADDFV